jgi:CheY-like chemotaxis protein
MPGAPPQTVVVVDDDPDIRAMVSEYLTRQGFDVRAAENGLEALLHVSAGAAAVVLDLRMPRLGGLEALKRIRAFDPAIRVVVVTGEQDAELRRRALVLGAAAFLSKPVVLTDLLDALTGPVIPPATQRQAAAGQAPVRAVSEAPPGSPARLLVVDDDAEFRAVLVEVLKRQGHDVRAAADGAVALQEVLRLQPDVVLLDINMPGMTGIEALPVIRAVASHAAVIMVTATTEIQASRRALAYGAFDYVVKPVDMAYLERSVATALAMRAIRP